MELTRREFTKFSFKAMVAGLAWRFMSACAAAALPFITMGLNLIATVLPTIPSIIAAIGGLVGKTISPTAVATLTRVFTGVQGLFQQAQASLTQYQANNDPTLISKIEDILGQVKAALATVLADVQITDQATVAKLTLVVNSFVDLANNILAILPQVINGKVVARKVSHAQMAQVTPAAWAAKFNEKVKAPSGNDVVDAAFASVKATAKS